MIVGNKLTKRRNTETKFKNQPLFIKPNNFKLTSKKQLAFNEKNSG